MIGDKLLKGVSIAGSEITVGFPGLGTGVSLIVQSVDYEPTQQNDTAEDGDGNIRGHGATAREKKAAFTCLAKGDTLAHLNAMADPEPMVTLFTIANCLVTAWDGDWNYAEGWKVSLRKDYGVVTFTLIRDKNNTAYPVVS